MQYLPALEAAGIQCTLKSFLDEDYLINLYGGRSVTKATLQGYIARLQDLQKSERTDGMWIQSEALPWVPSLIEKMAIPADSRYVIDCDDAIFHRYDMHRSQLVRRVLGRKIDNLMARSSMVTAGNEYLAERARAAGAPRVEIVPTVVDLAVYTLAPPKSPETPPVIGWIGTPSTWQEYMEPMIPLLTEVAAEEEARIHAVGASKSNHRLLDILAWTEDSEVSRIQSMDIGVMPLSDTPWSRGKCGYKLIQYMACGLPVIASPVGVNADIVEDGVNGFLVSTHQDWRDALTTLLRDPDLRARMGAAGRAKVERDFSLEVWGPRVATLLREAIAPLS